jgi:5-hydroxyisourate hydrolase
MSGSPITTHVLDTAAGSPAQGVPVVLEHLSSTEAWGVVGRGATDADGRAKSLCTGTALTAGTYRLTFQVSEYLAKNGRAGFYPYITIVFEVKDPTQHYHVPVLLSDFGFTTYRGS